MPITMLPNRAVLEVTGEDRVTYLQGLVSNDVTQATLARAVWAALLTPQGKWLADFFVTSDGSRLLLDVEAGQAGTLAQRLTRFRLRAEVAVQPTSLLVQAGWAVPMPPGATPDPRHPDAGWRLVADTAIATDATLDDWDLHRLRLGLPDGSADLEAEKTTLLEANFDELNGISWTKGCYMGQELTARTKYRGLLKRRLVPVRIDGVRPVPGAQILLDGADVGTMRSAQAGRGLALLRIEAIGRGPLDCAGSRLHPEPPAWMRLAPLRLAEVPG